MAVQLPIGFPFSLIDVASPIDKLIAPKKSLPSGGGYQRAEALRLFEVDQWQTENTKESGDESPHSKELALLSAWAEKLSGFFDFHTYPYGLAREQRYTMPSKF